MIWVMKKATILVTALLVGVSLFKIYRAPLSILAVNESTNSGELNDSCDAFDESGFCISCNGGGECSLIICCDGKHYDEQTESCVPDVSPTPTETPTPTPTATPTPTETPTPTPTCAPDSSLVNGVCMHPQPQLAPPSSDGRSDGRGGQAPAPVIGQVLGLASTGGEDEFAGLVESDSRLIVDSLEINLPVIEGGMNGDQWLLSNKAVLAAKTRDLTGASENTILYGHNWTGLLGAIGRIEVGDGLKYGGQNYRVVNVQKVSALNTEVLEPMIGKTLTIYTCTGAQNELRFVVTAILL